MEGESNRFGPVNSRNPRFEVKENVFLYLIFFIDEDHKGKKMISEASHTRLKNIKRNAWYDDKIHKAFCIPIQSVDEILTQIPAIILKHSEGDTKKVLIAELGVVSHAGGDGPISYNRQVAVYPEPKYKSQMLPEGYAQIHVEWTLDAKCVFYGCNTGSTNSAAYKNFALTISQLPNFKDVEVWGQSTSSFPSFLPDIRVTTVARSIPPNGYGWDVGETYQVAGKDKDGENALLGRGTVNPLNVYKNGTNVKSTHQGVFNDHR